MTKLFISYAHADSEIVLEISEELKKAGYEAWMDTSGIQGGTLWGREIVKGINACDIFLLFVSSRSILSDFVRRELDIAFDVKKRIIPVMIEKVDIPDEWDYQLAGIQYVNGRGPDWRPRLLAALGDRSAQPQDRERPRRKKRSNSSLPMLDPIERTLVLSNRANELAKAVEYLKDHRLLLITGMPGIGKSTFARALLEFIPEGTPPPFWYNFERNQSSGNSLGTLLDRLSSYLEDCLNVDVRREVMAFRNSPAAKASVSDVDVLIDYLNQDEPLWLVFDNLETVLSRDANGFLDEGLEILFDSLKNNTHNARIIITNPFVPLLREGEHLLEFGTQALALQGLDDESAVAYLRAYGLKELPENTLTSLAQHVGGHPFILNHMAHYIQTLGISAAIGNLQGGLEEINKRFEETLEQRLSSQEFTALHSMTVLHREVPLDGLCKVALATPPLIMRLREKGLLQTNEAGKFWLHNIVRNSLSPTEPDVTKSAHLRAMNYYRSLEVTSPLQSIDDYAAVLEWHHHAIEAGDIVSAYSALYSTGLEAHLMEWNEHELLAKLCEQTLAVVSLEQSGLSIMERVRIQHTLGIVHFYLGDFNKSIAYLGSALDALPPHEHQELRIRLLIDLSESHNSDRDSAAAMEICGKAISLLSESSHENLQARALHLRGIINRDQGHLAQAVSDLEEALKLYGKLEDQVHTANATVDLGIVYYSQNQFEEAVAAYGRVILLSEVTRDARGEMIAHYNIGNINMQAGKFEQAAQELKLALNISRRKKFAWLEALAGLDLVETYISLLDLDSAEQELSALKPLLQKRPSPCLSGQELALTACLHWKRGQMEQAVDYFKNAFGLLKDESCQEERARAYLAFAGFMQEQGHFDQAKEALQNGRNIFIGLNNQLGINAVEKRMLDFQNN